MFFLSAFQQALFFLPLTLGIYLSYRILSVTDLTVDGTFVLGASTFAFLITHGQNQYMSVILAMLAGSVAGALVALMQKAIHINSLIAGILATFMLYSVNFRIMGRPNINLINSPTLLGQLQFTHPFMLFVLMIVFTALIFALIYGLLHTRLGLLLRAYGNNMLLVKRMGKSTVLLLMLGLAISNSLAALTGVIATQVNGYADINMGLGMAMIAIGAVAIGRHLMIRLFYRKSQFNALLDCVSCLLGTFLYFLAMNFFLLIGVNPIYLKLLLGLVLVLFLGTARCSNYNREIYE
jgi:putative ABC transport system permease protein